MNPHFYRASLLSRGSTMSKYKNIHLAVLEKINFEKSPFVNGGETHQKSRNDSIKKKKCSRVITSEGFLQNHRNFYLTVFEIQRGTDGRRTDDGQTTDGRTKYHANSSTGPWPGELKTPTLMVTVLVHTTASGA